jgi:magnesium transporter
LNKINSRRERILRHVKRVSHKAGLSPGTVVRVGDVPPKPAIVSLISYDDKHCIEKKDITIAEALPPKDQTGVTWINVDGVHNTSIVEAIGAHFNLHPLVLEDIVTSGQRPKLEDYTDYLFVTLKILSIDPQVKEVSSDELSLLLGPNYVITLHETEKDIFDPVRERIRKGSGRLQKSGSDYLAYALIDSVVDNYFSVFENLGEYFEDLQDNVVQDPSPQTLQAIQHFRNELILLRKSVWPVRDVINGLQRSDSPLMSRTTEVYLRDVHDHTIQIIDTIETFRDMLSGMLDIYLSSASNRLNSVMKVLTIIATIFIPLTFFAGVYGMNFKFMPELEWRWGYPLLWVVMVTIAVSMLIWFRRKKWL